MEVVMKNGLFLSLAIILSSLQGCAFLELDSERESYSDYDRGYRDEESAGSEAKSTFAPADEDSGGKLTYEKRRVKRAIEVRDVVIGMTRGEVMESWGEPTQREVAGRGEGGHERWTFGTRYSLNGSRTVIFENGRVAGWSSR